MISEEEMEVAFMESDIGLYDPANYAFREGVNAGSRLERIKTLEEVRKYADTDTQMIIDRLIEQAKSE